MEARVRWVVATVPVDDSFRGHHIGLPASGGGARGGAGRWPGLLVCLPLRGAEALGSRPDAGRRREAMRSSLEAGGAFPHAARRPWGVSGGLSRLGCAASVVRLRRHPTTANAIGRSILVIIGYLLSDPTARFRDPGPGFHATRIGP